MLAAQVLGGLEHPAGHGVVPPPGRHARAGEPVFQPRAPRPHAPAQLGGVQLDLAHALRAPRQHELGGAGLHLQAAVEHRLQGGAAAAIDLHPRNLHRQSRVQRRDAPDRGGLAVGIALSEDDVVDVLGAQSGALHYRPDHRGRERGGGHVPEHAAEASHGGAHRLAYDRVTEAVGRHPGILASARPRPGDQ